VAPDRTAIAAYALLLACLVLLVVALPLVLFVAEPGHPSRVRG